MNGLVSFNINIKGLCYSPIKGPKGNIEFLLYFELLKREGKSSECDIDLNVLVSQVVDEAHEKLVSTQKPEG